MKRILETLVVALVLVLPLAACDDDEGTPTDTHVDGDAPTDTIPDTVPDPTPDTDVTTDPGTEDTGGDPGCVSITGGICNLVTQCGCSPGYYCEIFINSEGCTIIEDCQAGSGTLPVESECTALGQCSPGMACLRYTGEETGHCYEWCIDSSDCSIAGRTCDVTVNFTDGASCTSVPSPYQACSVGCAADAGCDLFDATAGTPCPTGQMCARDNPIASGGCDIMMCIEEGTGALGDECIDSGSGCLPNSGCYGNPTDGYHCRAYCDTTHTCSTGTCTTLGSEGEPDLGICI